MNRMASTSIAAATLLLSVAGAPGLVSVAHGQETVTADEVVARAVERSTLQIDRELELDYESVYEMSQESLDGDGEVQKVERRTYRRHPLEGAIYDELVAKNGRPLTPNEIAEERKRREKFVDRVRQRVKKGETAQPADENRVEFDEEFVSRYAFALQGEERVRGHDAWVLALEPRDGDLPVRRRIDRALNNATGTIWVSQDDYGVVRVEFEMARPVRFWGGLIGTLRNTVGRLEYDRIDDGVWLPVDMNIRLDLRIFFRNIRRRIIMDWEGYEPLGPNRVAGVGPLRIAAPRESAAP